MAPAPANLLERQRRLVRAPAGWLLFLVWAAAEEVHWAFYRALPLLLFGKEIGLWVGVLLIVAERYTAPRITAALRQAIGLEEEAWWLTKILVMTACFAILRNLWFCILIHALIEGVVAWLVQRHARSLGDVESPLLYGQPAFPALAFSSAGALLLLVLFAWRAAQPQSIETPSVMLVSPTLIVVPTPTPTRTALPSPSATPTVTPTPLPPSPTPTVTPTPPITYIVQPGDTLKEIAERFGVGVIDLMERNGITDPTKLQIGQELIIP
jgi:LysM repeat protein